MISRSGFLRSRRYSVDVSCPFARSAQAGSMVLQPTGVPPILVADPGGTAGLNSPDLKVGDGFFSHPSG
ncbi:Uncharacterised protein [Mycobacteroides abscessus]|nr:Uncharacterised protein [Mycobacteroides abscessus]